MLGRQESDQSQFFYAPRIRGCAACWHAGIRQMDRSAGNGEAKDRATAAEIAVKRMSENSGW